MSLFSGILDAEMIIGLSKGRVFHFLASLYSPLYVPSAVRLEVLRGGPGRAGVAELTQALGSWITEVIPDPRLVQQFAAPRSLADRAVLAVACEKKPIDHVLTGDRRLHGVATELGFTCLRTTDVIILLKDRGLVAEVKPVLDLMKRSGYGIDDARYEEALRIAGEWPTG